jgi:hypothetical protein
MLLQACDQGGEVLNNGMTVLCTGLHKDAATLVEKARKAGCVLDTIAYNTMLKAKLEAGL